MKINVLRQGGQQQGGIDQTGGTLTGPLILSRNPQLPLEAATKQYIDQNLQALNASNFTSGTLPIARLPALSGDVSNEAGSNSISLSNSGVTPGEYGKIVVNDKGRAINGTTLAASDIPNLHFSKITTDKPTTLAGYGITDAVPNTGVLMTGAINLASNPTSNEHLITKQYVDSMVNNLASAKTGDVVRKAYPNTPTGFLRCNGAQVSKSTYADLYAVIGDSNSGTYSVPGSGQPWRQQYEINSDQSSDLGSWAAGTSLPGVLAHSRAVVTKNRVYLIGGYNGSAWVNTVYTAPINIDGTLGTWATSSSLPMVCGVCCCFITKNRLYVAGGWNGSVYSSNVYYSIINSDGTLSNWVLDSNSLPLGLCHSSVIVTKSRVYLCGGADNVVSVSNIYSAPVNDDGTLGSWITESNTLPGALSSSQIVVTKNRVYLLGGLINGTSTANIYSAPINSDGTLGTWTTNGVLPSARGIAQVVVTKNTVYFLGGYTGSASVSTVWYAAINADGTLGTWNTGTSLTANFSASSVLITSSKIYLCGGLTSSYVANVYAASISGGKNDYSVYYEDVSTNYMMPGSGKPWQQQYQLNDNQVGDITGWGLSGNLYQQNTIGQAVVTKNRVYLIGGHNGTSETNLVQTAPINADGTLGTWVSTNAIPANISRSQAVVTKNRVYLIGGHNGTSPVATVYTAPINSDGTLGSWSTATNLPAVLSHSAAVITRNRVYLFGGYNGTSPVATVYTAPINSDGTLGTWVTSSYSLPTAFGWSHAAVTENRVYLFGGYNGSALISTIYTTKINIDGLIGPWSSAGNLPTVLDWSSIFVSKNYVYLMGGEISSGTTANVYYTTLNANGVIGNWTTGTAMPLGLSGSHVIVTKNKIHILGGTTAAGGYSSNIYTATIAEGANDYSPYYDGTITAFEPASYTTLFKLPDMSATDVNGIYHYIKF